MNAHREEARRHYRAVFEELRAVRRWLSLANVHDGYPKRPEIATDTRWHILLCLGFALMYRGLAREAMDRAHQQDRWEAQEARWRAMVAERVSP